MSNKFLQTSAVAAVIGLASINTQAASIWLEPVTQDTTIGGVVTLEMYADASDVGGFLAGGLDIFYDETIVSYNDDFAFDAAFDTDPAFSRLGDDCATSMVTGCAVTGEINGIAFGNFNGLAADGPTLVGTLSFNVDDLGVAILTMADNDFPAGNWFATDGTDLAGLVVYGEATINALIPVPAAVWLFGTGLLGLVGVARRRK